MAGAYGVLNELKDLCQALTQTPIPSQAIVICGQDATLYRSLDSVVENAVNPIARFGFVSNVEDYMGAADVMITKAGGLTVSEALSKRLPTIIYKPIPGVELENATFLERIGAGRTAYSQSELQQILIQLLDQPEELNLMAQAATDNFAGRSAERAVQHMLCLIDQSWENINAS
jgi:processive 1,2-diacylglycerol beta-glucosyltransferase